MNTDMKPSRTSPVGMFRFFSWLVVACGLLALVFTVLRVFEGGYSSPLEIQFRWYVFGAAISTIWFGWLGIIVSTTRDLLDKKTV